MAPNYQVDLLVVHPSNRKRTYQSLGDELSAIETPVWPALIANFARVNGFSVAILDTEAEDLNPQAAATRISEIKPLLTAIIVYGHQPSASTQNMTAASEVCTFLKEIAPDQKVIMVGGHVAALPERTLREEVADFIAGGEGPVTVVDLLHSLKATGVSDQGKVRGLWFRDGAAVLSNPPAPLVQNLDRDLPGMAWDLLPMGKYRAHNWHCFGHLERQPYAAIYTTLGCPYHCDFCCIQAPFKDGEKASGIQKNVNSYRFWSPEFVVSQIDLLVNGYGVTNLRISDEMFVLNRKHVERICDLIIERGYHLNMWAYARVDTVGDDRMVEKLQKAGFNWLCFGIESAIDRVRSGVDKSYAQESIARTVQRVRAAGINVIANYIFGLPDDDMKTMQATFDLSLDLNCEFANFYCGMAYPGSGLYNLALKNGWQLPEKWSDYSQHAVDTLPLPTKYLSASEVLAFRDEAWQRYFRNPAYLDLVRKKFGTATEEHIQKMTSHKLVRKYAPSSPVA